MPAALPGLLTCPAITVVPVLALRAFAFHTATVVAVAN
jgi:hypothetical protein